MVANSFATTSGFMTKRATWRRAATSPCLPNVIMRSARRRVSFAFATVVSMRSYWNSAVTRLRNSACRCSRLRPSLRWSLRCLMGWSWLDLGARRGFVLVVGAHVHAEVESHLGEDVLDLLQRLAAEVAELEHLRLALLHQLADGLDLRGAQAVAGTHRQLQLLDALVELLADADLVLVDRRLLLLLRLLLEADQQAEVVAQDLRRHRHGVVRQDAAVRPHLDRELIVVDALAQARGLDRVVHLRDRREQRIDRDHADRAVRALRVLVGRDVAAAAVDLDLHAQVAV